MNFGDLFSCSKPIIGMVHLLPLPGAPLYRGSLNEIYERALADAKTLADNGIDGMIIENFGDEPYQATEPSTHDLALIAAITREIRMATTMPLGVNIQFNAWQAELAVAFACQAQFVRVEVFIETVVSVAGIVGPCAPAISRYRKALGAATIQIWADVQTKYTTNLVAQTLAQSCAEAEAAGADAVIITGSSTGNAASLQAVREARQATALPILIGSGLTQNNAAEFLQLGDGAIVGSALKFDDTVTNAVDANRVSYLMNTVCTQFRRDHP